MEWGPPRLSAAGTEAIHSHFVLFSHRNISLRPQQRHPATPTAVVCLDCEHRAHVQYYFIFNSALWPSLTNEGWGLVGRPLPLAMWLRAAANFTIVLHSSRYHSHALSIRHLSSEPRPLSRSSDSMSDGPISFAVASRLLALCLRMGASG